MDTRAVLEYAHEEKVEFVDFRFTDLFGAWHHLTVPMADVDEDKLAEGIGFDASSLRGWAAINESDMLLQPDLSRYWIDQFQMRKTLCLICNVIDPITKQGYWLDPRAIAQRAEGFLRSSGIADTVCFGPEAEFFVFDHASFQNSANGCSYLVDSAEGPWNSSSGGGYHISHKEGYVPLAPLDSLVDLRAEISALLGQVGIHVECHHHEVATAGQCEIDFRFDQLTRTADNLQLFKYTVKNTARKFGKTATFMPKPLYGDNGSGMHCHQSLWKGEKPLFAGEEYAGLSKIALYYIGGLLKHAPAIAAFAAPTTNSYKRLVPGFEAPVNLAYSARNRSAAVRIPMFSQNPKAKRLEFRPPDPTCNPYITFAAMVMAGIDGIQNKIDPGQPLDKDIYDLPAEELKSVPSLPGSLQLSLAALEKDCDFLLRGDVFSEGLISRWVKYKYEKEIHPVSMRPHPLEFSLYYDA